ncbi:hypothetical protein Cfor_00784 [Coptotermes formosanus]|uniref:Uncharacterized protein n=1 Tax=Coptotermes formosanus TaxID=36987 RepID=A0A6L2PBL8_COPFO|nr:hypothetical protein Cfor_00784 [Coptotermes formosanus]
MLFQMYHTDTDQGHTPDQGVSQVSSNGGIKCCQMIKHCVNLFSAEVNDEEKMKSPVQKLTLDEIEQRAAYEIACGDVGRTIQYPVTAYEVLEALQVHRNVIPSHTVYSVNTERVISALNHPTNEEIEGTT